MTYNSDGGKQGYQHIHAWNEENTTQKLVIPDRIKNFLTRNIYYIIIRTSRGLDRFFTVRQNVTTLDAAPLITKKLRLHFSFDQDLFETMPELSNPTKAKFFNI